MRSDRGFSTDLVRSGPQRDVLQRAPGMHGQRSRQIQFHPAVGGLEGKCPHADRFEGLQPIPFGTCARPGCATQGEEHLLVLQHMRRATLLHHRPGIVREPGEHLSGQDAHAAVLRVPAQDPEHLGRLGPTHREHAPTGTCERLHPQVAQPGPQVTRGERLEHRSEAFRGSIVLQQLLPFRLIGDVEPTGTGHQELAAHMAVPFVKVHVNVSGQHRRGHQPGRPATDHGHARSIRAPAFPHRKLPRRARPHRGTPAPSPHFRASSPTARSPPPGPDRRRCTDPGCPPP